jgi:hypothetical protein
MSAFRPPTGIRRTRSEEREVHVTSPAPPKLWESVLAADPDALVSHTPAWMDLMCRCSGYDDASRLYELPTGRQLVVPMARRRPLLGSLATEASLPMSWGMGGIVAPGGVQPADVAAVLSDLARQNVARTSLRPNPIQGEMWNAAVPPGAIAIPRLAHVLALEGGFARVWKERFTGTARTSVRKAERSGLTVERDTSGRLVPVLYQLFERSVERWAEQQHEPRALALWRAHRRDPRRKFELMATTLRGACHMWVAWADGQPAAATVVLQAANASYAYGMMDKELAGPTQANYLLQQLAIEEACDVGCRHYHMGESGASASLGAFKARFGANAYRYAQYHLERLPITTLERGARGIVKRIIGFRD